MGLLPFYGHFLKNGEVSLKANFTKLLDVRSFQRLLPAEVIGRKGQQLKVFLAIAVVQLLHLAQLRGERTARSRIDDHQHFSRVIGQRKWLPGDCLHLKLMN